MGYSLSGLLLPLLGPLSPQAMGQWSHGLLVLLGVPVSGVCWILICGDMRSLVVLSFQ